MACVLLRTRSSAMTTSVQLALGSAATLLLYACDTPASVDPAANLTDNLGITDQQAIPQAEPRRDIVRDEGSSLADQEPNMPQPASSTTPPPTKPPVPPPTKPPAAPPGRVILPSPTQPPAEIDPVLPDPGDKVPL